MGRREIALQRIDISKGRGLELGPLYSPIVSKDEANIYYVDHMSTDDLKKKYKGHPFSVDDIVPVDYALGDRSLKETLKGKKFDYVIASHVIEHIPDMVSWLADVESVLKEGGILSLVIPDKRFTFDILRNESRPADVIGPYLDKHIKASSAVIYDFMSSVRQEIDASEVWNNPSKDYSKKPKNSLKLAYETCLENLKPSNYVDAHCLVFTPPSFFEIIRTLIEHNLFGYEIAYYKGTPIGQLEFYVSLRKVGKSSQAKRLSSVPKLINLAENSALEAELVSIKADLQNIINSKSWKITKPMRSAFAITKKVQTKLKSSFAES